MCIVETSHFWMRKIGKTGLVIEIVPQMFIRETPKHKMTFESMHGRFTKPLWIEQHASTLLIHLRNYGLKVWTNGLSIVVVN